MTADTIGIPLAYLIVTVLLLWAVTLSRGWWWLKAILVTVCVFFSLILWRSLEGLQGWPAGAEMPERFEINWLLTEEPNKKTGDSGAVYVLALDLTAPPAGKKPFFLSLHGKGAKEEPRLYRLDYTRALHEQAEEIKMRIGGGGRFFGMMKGGEGGLDEAERGGGKKGAGKLGETDGDIMGDGGTDRREGSLTRHQDYVFQELPPPRFPEKSAEGALPTETP